jgi:hypothetical protein
MKIQSLLVVTVAEGSNYGFHEIKTYKKISVTQIFLNEVLENSNYLITCGKGILDPG